MGACSRTQSVVHLVCTILACFESAYAKLEHSYDNLPTSAYISSPTHSTFMNTLTIICQLQHIYQTPPIQLSHSEITVRYYYTILFHQHYILNTCTITFPLYRVGNTRLVNAQLPVSYSLPWLYGCTGTRTHEKVYISALGTANCILHKFFSDTDSLIIYWNNPFQQ